MSTTADISMSQTESTNGIEVRRMDFSFDQVDTGMVPWQSDLTLHSGTLRHLLPGEQMLESLCATTKTV